MKQTFMKVITETVKKVKILMENKIKRYYQGRGHLNVQSYPNDIISILQILVPLTGTTSWVIDYFK